MKSKITGGGTEFIFTLRLMNKYDVRYYRCLDTGFIQTEDPYWLQEAYSSAITKLDVGMVMRNEQLREQAQNFIMRFLNQNGIFLDFAGGYGLFTRMMRDRGFNFFHHDQYCQNIFAEYFELADAGQADGFELVTAFEVFEHMEKPMEEIRNITTFSDHLLFTTHLQPQRSLTDWWYLAPETGQHIAFHTYKSLEYLATELGYNFYSNGVSIHLFCKNRLASNPFQKEEDPALIKIMRRKIARYDSKKVNKATLLERDFNYIKNRLRS